VRSYSAPVLRRRRTLVPVAVIVLLLAALGLASCGGGDDGNVAATTGQTTTAETTTTGETTTTEAEKPTVMRVVVVNAAPKGGIVRTSVDKGDRVVLVVTSDVADEIHLHGYDVSRDVAAGGTARLPFTATIPGRFEAELESRGVQIADITVQP
jgi:hypothetical protein